MIDMVSEGGVATITLASPKTRNVLSAGMVAALLDALTAAADDDAVRVVVLTNSGSTFCAGADLRQQPDPGSAVAGAPGLERVLAVLMQHPKPVVGRIDGHAVAGGVGLAAACDVSVARDDVLFGFTEVRVGVAPALISVVCLPKMRRGDAMEAFLRGARFPATRAAELGLVNHAVPAAELDGEVARIVDDLAQGGPEALTAAKALVVGATAEALEVSLAAAAARSRELFGSAEAREGMAAFREKRPPRWVI